MYSKLSRRAKINLIRLFSEELDEEIFADLDGMPDARLGRILDALVEEMYDKPKSELVDIIAFRCGGDS